MSEPSRPDRKTPLDTEVVSEKLRSSVVGIAGAGGLGSNTAMALARAGVGCIVIVDFDAVEASNLNRQYFFLDQVGQPKVEALKENIERAVKGCTIKTVNRKLVSGSMWEPFRDVDVVVEALDSASTKVSFIEDILLNLPDKYLVAASGVAGIGGSSRVREQWYDRLVIVEDPEALSSDEDLLLCPKVGQFAHHQANIVLDILLTGGRR